MKVQMCYERVIFIPTKTKLLIFTIYQSLELQCLLKVKDDFNLSHLMSELCSFKCLKLYSLNLLLRKRKLKFVCLSKFVIIVLHKNTRKLINHLYQAQKSITNLSNLQKIENCLPLTKTNREY